MEPTKFDLKAMLTGSIKRLAHVNRYSSLPVSRRENVAEHTAFVSLFCLIIAKDLEAKGYNVDRAKLLTSALLHDLDESLSGDFLRSVKLGIPGLKELLDTACKGFMKSISEQLGVDLTTEWSHAKDESLEGNILAIADLLGVATYLLEEFASGNRHIFNLFRELDTYLESLEPRLQSSLIPYLQEGRQILNRLVERYTDTEAPSLMPASNLFNQS